MTQIKAPFTPEQVRLLNIFQHSGTFHPFTCGSGNRTDANHLDGEGILMAIPYGWVCPYCSYRQDWAHDFMAKPLPSTPGAADADIALGPEVKDDDRVSRVELQDENARIERAYHEALNQCTELHKRLAEEVTTSERVLGSLNSDWARRYGVAVNRIDDLELQHARLTADLAEASAARVKAEGRLSAYERASSSLQTYDDVVANACKILHDIGNEKSPHITPEDDAADVLGCCWGEIRAKIVSGETALSEAQAALTAATWKSIETAPKDGTDFLALIPHKKKHHQMVGRFTPHGSFISWPGQWNYHPTHWQSLPTVPVVALVEGEAKK